MRQHNVKHEINLSLLADIVVRDDRIVGRRLVVIVILRRDRGGGLRRGEPEQSQPPARRADPSAAQCEDLLVETLDRVEGDNEAQGSG
jgi:hypothetical protein